MVVRKGYGFLPAPHGGKASGREGTARHTYQSVDEGYQHRDETMKKSFFALFIRCILPVLPLIMPAAGCSGGAFGGGDTAALLRERDSLRRVASQRDSQLTRMTSYFDTLSSALDSIRSQEQILTLPYDSEGRRLPAARLRENLETLQAVYDRQRDRIGRLESRLARSRDSVGQYRTLITYLYSQLDEKDAEIRRMRQEINSQKTVIQRQEAQARALREDIDNLEAAKEDMMGKMDEQQDLISAQAEIINTGYYVMAPLKTLQDFGLVSRNIGKKRVLYSGMDLNLFTRIDILAQTHFDFRANTNPKILSPVPQGSYTMTRNPDGTTSLDITDPRSFWSISTYLVIQL